MTQKNIDIEEKVAHVETVMSAFELEHPDFAVTIQTLGMTIDEYERILAESEWPQTETSNNTSG